jgi:hypothetical protein
MKKKLFTVFLFLILTTLSHAQEPYVINSLADDQYSHAYDDPATPTDESRDGVCRDEKGRCTLRAAIEEAHNRNTAAKFIFNVSGKINLAEALTIDDGCIIDGGNTIELSGIACLEVQNAATVRGLKFSNAMVAVTVNGDSNHIGVIKGSNVFVDNTIALVVDGDNNKVVNNYIGVDAKSVLHPNQAGVMVTGSFNSIGDSVTGNGNTICGSAGAGIELSIGGFNSIQGNNIGTDYKGTPGLGNNQGITIGGSDFNMIGGYEFGAQNFISGNTLAGIFISGVDTIDYSSFNQVIRNLIGLTPDETAALPNGQGIIITNGVAVSNIQENIISGNTGDGISIFSTDSLRLTKSHKIGGNNIGINWLREIFPNGRYGIGIEGLVTNVGIGEVDTSFSNPNTIVGNGKGGISVRSANGFSPNNIRIQGNMVYKNTGFNLSIDTLSNERITAPSGLSLKNNIVKGSYPLSNYMIDVYQSSTTESAPSAVKWLGSTMTDANGVFAFALNDPNVKAVAVTATSKTTYTAAKRGNTSNFAMIKLPTRVLNENAVLPTAFALEQNYPNPFNPTTTIRWQVAESGPQLLQVYDVLGREVATLVNEVKQPGTYTVQWDASGMESGMYFYRLAAGSKTETKKLLLVR